MVVHFEIDPERMKVAMEKTDQMRELIKKNPEDYPKFVTPGYIYNGETKGFQVIVEWLNRTAIYGFSIQ